MIDFDIVVIGNVGIDTNIYLDENEVNFDREADFPENLDCVGQAGGYTARGFAQLGYRTAFIGYVGGDFSGRYILDAFAKDSINTDAVFIDPAGTSRSANFMFPDGRRKTFYDGKSHMHLEPDLEQCAAILDRTKHMHCNIPHWARHLLPLAKQGGISISCDVQDIIDINSDYHSDFIKYADILFFSTVNHTSPEDIMQQILAKHPEKIIISGMAGRGCAVATNAGIEFFDAVNIPQVVIDCNGAGDGLAVGFLSAHWFEHRTIPESILRGQFVARHTCTQKGTSDHLITKSLLQDYLNQIKNNH